VRFRLTFPLIWLLAVPLLLSGATQMGSAQGAAAQTPTPAAGDDYSGMYTFLKDGEFVQITIEAKGLVSGFISRFGDSDNEHGTFLDQFFKSGKSEGSNLSFTTEIVHGVWFAFDGTFERGPGKKPDEEAYYLLRGALTRFSTDAEKKVSSQVTQVEFKSFPRDAAPPQ
jgi:hypothetical protein